MGQKLGKCVQGESADDDGSDVYTLPEDPPLQSTADSRDHSPPPARATDGDVGDNRDGGRKKRRFWRKFFKKGRKSARGEREELTKHPNTPAPSTADARDHSPRATAVIHEEVEENRDEGKKKKKRRFWKRLWSKCRRGAQSEREESDRSPEDQIHNNLLNQTEELHEDGNVIYEINSCQYKTGQMLSTGEYGSVYEATRVSDGLKVAVKIVRVLFPDFISIPGHTNFLHREIALHILASEGHVPEIIRLLDWEERYRKYVMVLENPSPCMDLFTFIQSRGGKIPENLARIIMRQAVKAVIECFIRGVFHMDTKLENFLINTETFDVKLIDFGLADRLGKTCYSFCSGTMDYWCPELMETGWYHAFPATVWKLGLMLYKLLCGNLPDTNTQKQIRNKKWRKDDLTKECCRFINTCLQEDPHQRILIKNILLLEWFQVSGVDMIDSCFEGVSEDQMQENQETPELLNETDDLTEAGDLLTSHHSSVSDSSDEGLHTPALSLSDLYANVPRRTVSSESDSESVDSFHTAVCSVWGLLENNEDGNVIYEINSCQYKTGQMLSTGEYGSVYEATRVSDGLKVAVKIVRVLFPDFTSIPGHPNPVPEIIRLLDWEERDDKYVMVLENPSPCMDLFTFIQSRGGKIPENLARIIMRQAVKAVIECFQQEVFHMRIKLENLLINTETFDVKLIDFGFADRLRKTPYRLYLGTMDYWCPELMETGWYHAFPATVWKLGLMLYKLLCGNLPDTNTQKQIRNKKWRKDDLTKECCRFINTCLQEDPHQRILIKNILLLEWFQVSGVDMIDSCFEGVSEDQMQENQETPELLNETDDLTEAGDLLTSHHSSVSDSSDEGLHTPALSLSDLYANVPRRTVSSGSDSESVDSFHTAVCSVWGLLENNEDGNVIYEINSCQYKTGQMLSTGEYGSVYEATRVSDGLKVAVKIVRVLFPDFTSIPGHPNPLHREIALHILASEGHVPEIIRLLDWEERDDKYVMVLENPSPCMDLFTFIQSRGGKIPENLARIIMRQAVKAVIECFQQEVFHMRIKLENFLINTETFDVKLIDFGFADRLRKTPYRLYLGTMDYWCPELMETGWYHAFPATVWKLGLMLYKLLCGNLPDTNTQKQIRNKKWRKDDLTKECCRFINTCLQEDPHQRILIKNILLLEWFQLSDVETRVR